MPAAGALAPENPWEKHAYAIATRPGQPNSGALARLAQKAMGKLHQNAGPITRIRLTAPGAAMVQVAQDSKAVTDDGV